MRDTSRVVDAIGHDGDKSAAHHCHRRRRHPGQKFDGVTVEAETDGEGLRGFQRAERVFEKWLSRNWRSVENIVCIAKHRTSRRREEKIGRCHYTTY